MDYQILFNVTVVLCGTLGGWVLGRITKSLDRLDEDVRALPEKYVLKSDFSQNLEDLRNTIKHGFERVFDKLDGKVDK